MVWDGLLTSVQNQMTMNAPMMFIASIMILLGLVLFMEWTEKKLLKRKKQYRILNLPPWDSEEYDKRQDQGPSRIMELVSLKRQLRENLQTAWNVKRECLAMRLKIGRCDFRKYYNEYDALTNWYENEQKKISELKIDDLK
jgi:hypothetical protein